MEARYHDISRRIDPGPNRREPIAKGSSRPNLYAGICTEMAWNTDSDKYVRRGRLNGNPVRLLLDTGSTLSMVSGQIVCNRIRWTLRRKLLYVAFMGIVWSIPQQWCNYKSVTGKGVYVRVAVAPELPVPVLLGKDVFRRHQELRT